MERLNSRSEAKHGKAEESATKTKEKVGFVRKEGTICVSCGMITICSDKKATNVI